MKSGIDDGGDISIRYPIFVILDKAKIVAHAEFGRGGNINIASQQFIASPDSLVSASSRLGLDGDVKIDSPDENVTEGMLALSSDTVDASYKMKKPCEMMSYEEYQNRSRFEFHPIAGCSASPFDLQPSRLSQQSTKKVLTQNQKSGRIRQMAMVTVCQSEKVQEKTLAESENSVMPEQLF